MPTPATIQRQAAVVNPWTSCLKSEKDLRQFKGYFAPLAAANTELILTPSLFQPQAARTSDGVQIPP
jgi:hypothetical protein